MNDDKFNEHLVISGRDERFQEDLTKASIDGWKVLHINSFPVEKPDYLKQRYHCRISVYRCFNKRKRQKRLKASII